MNETAKQEGRIVESTASAVANWSVARQAELDPGLEQRYGARWREEWVGHVASQMQFLAQAIAVRRPQLFADSAQWTRAAFDARGAQDSDLINCLRCMHEVIEAELPEAVAATAAEFIGQAIESVLTGSGPVKAPSVQARAELADRFRWERMVRTLEELYYSMLS